MQKQIYEIILFNGFRPKVAFFTGYESILINQTYLLNFDLLILCFEFFLRLFKLNMM